MKFICTSLLGIFSFLSFGQLPDPPAVVKKEIRVEVTEEIIELCGCECEPEFPGGFTALQKYLVTNIVYPERAKRNGEAGKVYVQFDVIHDGSIRNIEIVKGISYDLDNEALRIIREMPCWANGYDSRTKKPISAHIRLGIDFVLLK